MILIMESHIQHQGMDCIGEPVLLVVTREVGTEVKNSPQLQLAQNLVVGSTLILINKILNGCMLDHTQVEDVAGTMVVQDSEVVHKQL